MILMATLFASTVAGCQTTPRQMPLRPMKPTNLEFIEYGDRGFCLARDDAATYLRYVRALEQGYD